MKKGKRYLILILAAVVLAAAGSGFAAWLQYVPVYQTNATLVILRSENREDVYADLKAASDKGSVFAELLNSSLMQKNIREELGMEQFTGTISASMVPETNLLEVTVTAADPDIAYDVICTVMEEHEAVTSQVMGKVPVAVLQEPERPDAPVNPMNFMDRMVRAAVFAALFSILLFIWHAWSLNAVGIDTAEGSRSELDLVQLLADTLRQARRIWIAGLGLIVACSLGLSIVRWIRYEPVYETSAAFTVRLSDQQKGEEDSYSFRTADQLAKTLPHVLTGEVLLRQIMDNLVLDDKPDVRVSVSSESKIITLTVADSDPDRAWEVLSAILSCYPQVAEYVVGPTKLLLLEETGIPAEPSNPFAFWVQMRNGGLLGAGLWMIAAMLLAVYHTTVRRSMELSQLLHCECLGQIPDAMNDLSQRVAELMSVSNHKILLISGVVPGEEKTMAAWNLAVSLAKNGKRVLLVECDLYHPILAKRLGIKGINGLLEYLMGQLDIRDCIRKTRVENLYLIPLGSGVWKGGAKYRNRAAKLGQVSRKLFDYVILDGPQASRLTEISGMAELVDCSLLVVRQGALTRDKIKESADLLQELGIPVAGSALCKIHP